MPYNIRTIMEEKKQRGRKRLTPEERVQRAEERMVKSREYYRTVVKPAKRAETLIIKTFSRAINEDQMNEVYEEYYLDPDQPKHRKIAEYIICLNAIDDAIAATAADDEDREKLAALTPEDIRRHVKFP